MLGGQPGTERLDYLLGGPDSGSCLATAWPRRGRYSSAAWPSLGSLVTPSTRTPQADAQPDEVPEARVVGGGGVVAVDAVLRQQLRVGLHAVLPGHSRWQHVLQRSYRRGRSSVYAR